jgi:hypothetical protein
MDKDVAGRMLKAALALEARIGELDVLVGQLNDEKERDEYVHALGNVIGIISENFVRRRSLEIRSPQEPLNMPTPCAARC